jgi:hypothetical protein
MSHWKWKFGIIKKFIPAHVPIFKKFYNVLMC